MTQYKSLVLTHFGEDASLSEQENSQQPLQSTDVLVKVAYCGINPIDIKTKKGTNKVAEANAERTPWTPGYDISGTVVAVGDEVESLKAGDTVAGMVGFALEGGGYSQYWQGDAALLTPLMGQDLAQAAAFPLAALTAHQALFQHAGIAPNQKVLIIGAGGGVGILAVQLAQIMGATVYTSSSPADVQLCSQLGAEEAFSYTQGDEIAALKGVDVIIDLVGGIGMLTLLELGLSAAKLVTIPTNTADVVIAQAQESGIAATGMLVEPNRALQDHLFGGLAAGIYQRVTVGGTLGEMNAIHQQIEDGKLKGKVVVACA